MKQYFYRSKNLLYTHVDLYETRFCFTALTRRKIRSIGVKIWVFFCLVSRIRSTVNLDVFLVFLANHFKTFACSS